MTAFDFLKWCFSDGDHTISTLIVGWFVVWGVTKILLAARGVD